MSERFEHLGVRVEAEGRLLQLDLDHGKANEIGRAQLAELARLAALLEAGEVRALVSGSRRVTAQGTAVFCAGADVTERRGWDDERILEHVREQRRIMRRLAEAPVLHVCAVDGLALGWGTELVLASDYAVAGPRARFGLPETGLGIVPGAGGTARLAQRVGLGQALRLGICGELCDAAEALRIGLVHELCPSGEAARARALVLAERCLGRSPTAIAAFKAAVRAGNGLPEDAREALEERAYEHCVRSGDAARGRDGFEAIRQGRAVAWGPRVPFPR